MSIEEAEYILNEAVISEPSISSYTYISAEEINQAINVILEERFVEQEKIKELENKYIKEINKLTNIINEKNKEVENYKSNISQKGKINFKNIIKYIKKLESHFFGLKISLQ